MSTWNALSRIVGATLVAGVAAAAILTPIAAVSGYAVSQTSETMKSDLADITNGDTPGVTTILDANGGVLASIYSQQRFSVDSEAISPAIKNALVAIEDRRFYEHNGVDLQGNLRAMATNLLAGGVEQGASTLDQQYVKNFLLLVTSEDDEDQAAATETSIPRKLREMQMASTLDRDLSKDEILTRYLNLVHFGNGAYGVEAAARTYFGISAAELSIPQSAMLAGIVQSSSYLDPYTNEQAVIDRRNVVLDAMVDAGYLDSNEAALYKVEPLGVQEFPGGLPNGCINAGNSGFFCDYVLEYLADKGFDYDTLTSSSYTIQTTLDPNIQAAAEAATKSQVASTTPGVADVTNVVAPGTNSHEILAMASSRDYGLDLDAGQTVLPQTASLVGNGAGSIFKIFTAAAALEQGYGLDTYLDTPTRYQAAGMGEGGASNCPTGYYCVENSGSYAASMRLRDALAQSPNTTFVKLLEEVGVDRVVDISVALGLRSYADAGSFDGESSVADYVKEHNLGSYTLGPTAVNALELSNVAATLASDGVWCEPSPVRAIYDSSGTELYLETPDCEQAIDAEVAQALSNGMSQDTINGTAANAANAVNWAAPLAAKTGTTESYQSAAFFGFNSNFAAATYIYNDGTTVFPLCSGPVVQCPDGGSLYGGTEPARTWFQLAQATQASSGTLSSYNPDYNSGSAVALANTLRNRNAEQVERELREAGFEVTKREVTGDGVAKGRVVNAEIPLPMREGTTIVLNISDGKSSPRTLDTTTGSTIPSLDYQAPQNLITEDPLQQFTDGLRSLFGG
ncbi:MAG: transglycosylase domain-containing protein [Corynebacterium sp.]|nr:transglycosylase domain-containing protein [Corynebacterium sp.]